MEWIYYDCKREVEIIMDLKKAYEIMELPENSSKEEVEKRFDILVRRMRGNSADPEVNHSEDIIKAYNVIKEFEKQQKMDQYNVARFGTNIKKKERSEKMEHFWIQHRLKVMISIISIIVLAIVANIVIKNIKDANLPKPVLEVMMYGDYNGGDESSLVKGILTKFTDWKQVKAIINYLPSGSGAMDSAYVQKSFVMLATERPDVYILDKITFETMLAQNALSKLDSWKNELSANHAAEQLLTATQKDDTEAHLYGVDISDDPIWKTMGLPQGDKIAVLSLNQKHVENSKRFIINF
jgi:hypothetical protein